MDDKSRIRQDIVYYKEFRSQIVSDLADYEAGTHYTGEIRNGARIDTTPQTIAELKRRLAKTDNLIAAYEALLHA
jgi:hypothetical protein